MNEFDLLGKRADELKTVQKAHAVSKSEGWTALGEGKRRSAWGAASRVG